MIMMYYSVYLCYIAAILQLFVVAKNPVMAYSNLRSSDSSEEKECPPWSVRNNTTNVCQCLTSDLLMCLSHNYGDVDASLPFCYCLAYNDKANTVVIGRCVIRCHMDFSNPVRKDCPRVRYYVLNKTNNVTEMNQAYCSDLGMNRTGQLCGSCLEGHTPPVYSYDMACVECSDYKYNWLKYIAVAYLPLTVFCMIIIVFRINVTSGSINSYIMSIQIVTSPAIVRLINITVITNTDNTFATQLVFKILLTLYGFWNLDFFRLIYTPFCLHPSMTMLETLVLDYAIAVYPLLLVIIIYLLVKLHDCSPFIVRVWRPFYRCLTRFRAKWNIKSSLVGAFATFILLSYVKILNISLDLLTTVSVYKLNGTRIKQLYLSIDPTIELFGKQHLPYALLALFMLLLFNILPLVLLCVYPCRCFQRCMDHFRLHSHSLHTFVEVFQGPFKIHPRDYRYFAAFYLLLRIVNLFLIVTCFIDLQTAMGVIIFSFATFLIAVTKPHKSKLHNNVDIAIILWLIMVLSFISSRDLIENPIYHLRKCVYNTVILIIGTLHPLYGICALLSVFISGQRIKAMLIGIYNECRESSVHQSQTDDDDDGLPYRLEHSSERTPLIDRINCQ